MPNTKTKKFDWQIFLAVFCILLVICCATICCVIGNSEKGVANAYTDEEVGVSNLEFSVDEGFYIKNFNNANNEELERLINYYFYFIPGLMDTEVDFYYNFQVGYIDLHYLTFTDTSLTRPFLPIYMEISQDNSDYHYLHINCFISENSNLYFFELTYDFGEGYLDEFLISVYSTETTNYPYSYYVDFTDRPLEGTFVYQFLEEVFGDAQAYGGIESLDFHFYNVVNLGIFFSPNETFASAPIVMPDGVYNDNLQDKYDEGYLEGIEDSDSNLALIEELREEIRYYESLDLNLSTVDVFNPARMKSSTFVYDGVTYTSNSIVSTDDGWDIYSSTYHNEELPPNYGVGFSLFLPEYITNTKFYVYGDITGWYNYTYCSEPDEQGNQQCYQVSDMIATISVGYRNQNGNIVKVGTFTSNLPSTGGVDFFIDSPTNEIVFFVENCNLMEVGRDVQVIYYQFDTQSIYNDGYENGKSQGIQIGRQEGYYEGVADANDYSFFSLFTSVFDAPITAIVGKWGDSDGDGVYQREGGMLNFYIPGLEINFAPFLLSLFTIAIIILVIRFIMARKS